jgi:hypothetical protein
MVTIKEVLEMADVLDDKYPHVFELARNIAKELSAPELSMYAMTLMIIELDERGYLKEEI